MPMYNSYLSPKMKERLQHVYDVLWTMLVRRLRYPKSRKARRARERILIHWRIEDLVEAEKQAIELRSYARKRILTP